MESRNSRKEETGRVKTDRGFTLIELLVCLAVAGILILGIGSFMSAGTKSYRSIDASVSLQVESQTIINQLRDLFLSCTNVIQITDTEIEILYPAEKYKIYLEKESGRDEYGIYLQKYIKQDSGSYVNAPGYEKPAAFGSYVKSLKVELIQEKNGSRLADIILKMKNAQKEYEVTDKVKLRNTVKSS